MVGFVLSDNAAVTSPTDLVVSIAGVESRPYLTDDDATKNDALQRRARHRHTLRPSSTDLHVTTTTALASLDDIFL